MRTLSIEEKLILEKRRNNFESFSNESIPVLVQFLKSIEHPNADMISKNAKEFLEPMDTFLKHQIIDIDDRNWILTRVGYFIGEYFIQYFNGCWFLNEIVDSKYFLHYVVGKFNKLSNKNAMVEPFDVADAYLSDPPGRSLKKYLEIVNTELEQL